jgi:hypothetical protein
MPRVRAFLAVLTPLAAVCSAPGSPLEVAFPDLSAPNAGSS